MSVFTETNHLFLRNPGGEINGNAAQMKAASFGAIFANVGDYPVAAWDAMRASAKQAGIICGPWLRTADEHTEFDSNRLTHLIEVADDWGTPLIVNSEKEIDATGSDLTSYIARQVGDRDAAISSEIRPYGAVDWTPLGHLPALPQRFPAEQAVMDTDDEIRRRWWEAGFSCVVVTYGAYHGMQPTQFPRLSPYGVYTGNDMLGQFMPWQPAGEIEPCKAVAPPKPPEVDMQRIGKQHGIVATHARLRELDPEGSNPAFNPAKPFALPIEQLRAYDRWARTMTILVQDHDAQV